MLRVALTGGIGSGKTEVTERLASLGAVIVDADVAAREVVRPGTPGCGRLVSEFGKLGVTILGPDGAIDRQRLARIVFADPERRALLNAIVHPLVRTWMTDAEDAARAANADAIVIHAIPLLAESLTAGAPDFSGTSGTSGTSGVSGAGRERSDFDLIVVVDVPAELRVERLVASGRVGGPDQVRDRMRAQASREQRLAIADLVLDNSGTLADLDRRVAGLWDRLRACGTGSGPPPGTTPPGTTPPGTTPPGAGVTSG